MYHVGIGVITGDISDYTCVNFINGTDAGTAYIYNNTCYDVGAVGGATAGAFAASTGGSLTPGNVNFTNNIVYTLAGETYVTPNSESSVFRGSNNLFFGSGPGPVYLTGNVNSDPLFV